jgi:uncharacterized membrane protein YtjA (UPF0391 family)
MSFRTVTNPQKKNSTVTIASAAGYRPLGPPAEAARELPVVAMAIFVVSLFSARLRLLIRPRYCHKPFEL